MRAQRPVSEAHLADGVRRGVITAEQMESLLAIARSDASSGDAHLPDLRWTAVVSAVAATVAVGAPGFAMLIESRAYDELGITGLTGACIAALVTCALLGQVARARGWGRAPAAILTAGVAPYTGGVALYVAALGFRDLAQQTLAATVVATLVGLALWRARRVGPALAVAGFCLPFAVMSAARMLWPVELMTPFRAMVVATAALSLAAAARLTSWGRRGGVDGTSWWELGTFAAAMISVTAGFSRGLGGVELWAPAALVVGALGLWFRRWTYQLAGALGMLWFLGLGLRHEAAPLQVGGLVGVCVLIAAATQWHRRREAHRIIERDPRADLRAWE
ncbi:MAG: hypothetical protein Q8S73_12800 [Deltaproteobacteria bacterium]|nr:hypothetical protein [Myxococcales bacterium]MDP3214979.1 hypothetical protein [Deltaproteobacteria bacterium]